MLRCLAKAPAERYDSAVELVEDLERYIEGGRTRAADAGRRQARVRLARRAALVGVVLAVGLGAVIAGDRLRAVGGDGQRAQVQQLAREARDHLRQGNLRAAGRLLTAARALDPARPDLAADLARCLVAGGELEEGLRQLDEAVRLGWRDPALLEAPELAGLKDDPRLRDLRAQLTR